MTFVLDSGKHQSRTEIRAMTRILTSSIALVAFFSCMSLHAQSPTLTRDNHVWVEVTRVKEEHAEFNLNRSHGLRAGERVWICRKGQTRSGRHLGQMTTLIVDDKQAVGRAEGFLPRVGDLVLFERPQSRAEPKILPDKLIGTYVYIIFESSANQTSPARALVSDVLCTSGSDIREIEVVFPGTQSVNRTLRYKASQIRSMRAGNVTYKLDAVTQTLVESSVLDKRVSERALWARIQAEEALRREEIARAEEQRHRKELAEAEERHRKVLAEVEERHREELAKVEEHRREELAKAEEERQRKELAEVEERRHKQLAKAEEERHREELARAEERRREELAKAEEERRREEPTRAEGEST
jgi:hypothetical protein